MLQWVHEFTALPFKFLFFSTQITIHDLYLLLYSLFWYHISLFMTIFVGRAHILRAWLAMHLSCFGDPSLFTDCSIFQWRPYLYSISLLFCKFWKVLDKKIYLNNSWSHSWIFISYLDRPQWCRASGQPQSNVKILLHRKNLVAVIPTTPRARCTTEELQLRTRS